MAVVEQATKRLEQALDRLEQSMDARARGRVSGNGAAAADTDRKAGDELDVARRQTAALRDVAETVAGRLDSTIERLRSAMET